MSGASVDFVVQPVCYGWKYLKAVDGLVEDKAVDTEYLGQAVSDMLDMRSSHSSQSRNV